MRNPLVKFSEPVNNYCALHEQLVKYGFLDAFQSISVDTWLNEVTYGANVFSNGSIEVTLRRDISGRDTLVCTSDDVSDMLFPVSA